MCCSVSNHLGNVSNIPSLLAQFLGSTNSWRECLSPLLVNQGTPHFYFGEPPLQLNVGPCIKSKYLLHCWDTQSLQSYRRWRLTAALEPTANTTTSKLTQYICAYVRENTSSYHQFLVLFFFFTPSSLLQPLLVEHMSDKSCKWHWCRGGGMKWAENMLKGEIVDGWQVCQEPCFWQPLNSPRCSPHLRLTVSGCSIVLSR